MGDIVGLETSTFTLTRVIAVAASSSFVSGLESQLGSTIRMHVAPAIAVAVVSAPPPPPASPPSPTTAPLAAVTADSLATDGAASSSQSTEMLWVVIAGAIALVAAFGCACAYCLRKRFTRNKTRTVQVGRPALRRQVTPEEHRAATQSPKAAGVATNAALVEDVRLLELGMAAEGGLALPRQLSVNVPDPFPASSQFAVAPDDSDPNADVSAKTNALKLDSIPVAIDDEHDLTPPVPPPRVRARAGERANISPRSQERRASSPRSTDGAIVESRIRATPGLPI